MWQELRPEDPGRIGPYQLRGILGTGGMGRVFLGASADGQLAAVKVIRADLATDPEFRARFGREVTVAHKVSSPFTAALIGADADSPVPWLATAYVPGPSLADAVAERGPLSAASVRELAAGLAAGLNAIHAAGVVHRDLKPSNVLLAQDGPRIIDFGISVTAQTSPLTRTGLLIGSPGYMSPEQVEGREVGPPSDIFSLGAVLAFAATGEAPFGSGSAPTLAYRAVYRQVNLDRVPAEVRGLIECCLAKDPRQRPAARDLMSGAGPAAPAQLSQPGPALPAQLSQPGPAPHTVTDLPVLAGPSMTVTSARLVPAPPEPVSRQRGRQTKRRLARPLAVASVLLGVLAASAAGGVALAASAHQASGAHSGTSATRQAVTGQSATRQAVGGGMTSPAASPMTGASTMPATVTTAAAATSAPIASPPMTTAPASPTAAVTASSAPAPAASPSVSSPAASAGTG